MTSGLTSPHAAAIIAIAVVAVILAILAIARAARWNRERPAAVALWVIVTLAFPIVGAIVTLVVARPPSERGPH